MAPDRDQEPRRRSRFLIGFLLIWGALAGSAGALGGDVAFGLAVLAVTLVTALLWERLAYGTPLQSLVRDLGMGRPTGRSILAAGVISACLLAFYPAYGAVSGHPLSLRADWLWLALGLFAYHGMAEELAWRGYAFRRLREGASFGSAIWRTMPLIAITHLPIVVTHGPAVGGFAILVAAVTCLPFGYLWERGAQTIWAPAMLHAAIDAFALIEVPEGRAAVSFSITLAIVSLVVPLGVFAFGDRFFGTRRAVAPQPSPTAAGVRGRGPKSAPRSNSRGRTSRATPAHSHADHGAAHAHNASA